MKYSKKGTVAWRYIVLLVIGLVALMIILYSGVWKSLPIISELIQFMQDVF